ncbi:MAG: hypothetical protein L0387_16255 [Acidobacteria bacterium]|nr:hypothetical protein [Acidobacteriota bacterium]MCI0623181.1 hypothetical protein [Acidobacteriota bacterium]MCI0721387.1 hypothetical protein [Acidobacteriota bacterium]
MKWKLAIVALALGVSSDLLGEPAAGDVLWEYTYTVRFSKLDPSSAREGLEQHRERSLKAWSRQSPLPSLTIGLLKSTEAKSVARATAMARLRFNHFQDFDGALSLNERALDIDDLKDATKAKAVVRGRLAAQKRSGEQASRKWWDSRWRYRIPLRVEANRYERKDQPVEAGLDFTQALEALGVPAALGDTSLRVIEVSAQGELLDENVPFQFDDAEASASKAPARGILTWLLKGVTSERSGRHFFVYFDSAGKFETGRGTPLVGPVETLLYEGQETFKISTRSATYFYHKDGAGLASMLDKDGNDWISYHPGGRSAGEFRGIPNLGDFAHPGYSGDKGARTQVLHQGPLKMTVTSENSAKTWVTRWEFYPDYARMTVLKNETPYWFLYEGTPGGKLDEETDFHVLSDGLRRSNKEHWSGDILGPEWIYFGDGRLKRMLYLVNHQDDDATDQFWPMEGNMTVFGFGRQYRCCGRYLSAAPASFTIGFGEDSEFAAASRTINGVYQDLGIVVGRAERQPKKTGTAP